MGKIVLWDVHISKERSEVISTATKTVLESCSKAVCQALSLYMRCHNSQANSASSVWTTLYIQRLRFSGQEIMVWRDCAPRDPLTVNLIVKVKRPHTRQTDSGG